MTTPYRTPESPDVAPLSEDELLADAVSRVLSALHDLDGDQTRDVLLSVSALFNLGLAHVDSDGAPTLSVSDVERLLKAARGTP